jgi:membrane-associated phospholipid phosphatase
VPLDPPPIDIWIAVHLARIWGLSQVFDTLVDQSVGHWIFGGVWYAAALFAFWVMGAQPGRDYVRVRVLTIALGSLIAALLTVLLQYAVLWPPPSAHPEVAGLYPDSFPVNVHPTSFPSQSTALYAAVACGIFSLRKAVGVLAWTGIALFVALPRMYLGGHYLTDVLAGVLAAVGGYLAAVWVEPIVASVSKAVFQFDWDRWQRLLAEALIFFWLLAVATECRHVVWVASNCRSRRRSAAA